MHLGGHLLTGSGFVRRHGVRPFGLFARATRRCARAMRRSSTAPNSSGRGGEYSLNSVGVKLNPIPDATTLALYTCIDYTSVQPLAETDRDMDMAGSYKKRRPVSQRSIDHGAGRRCLPQPGVAAVTGCDKAVGVCRDVSTLSSCNSVGGPYPPLRVQPGIDDVSDVIEAHRDQWPMSEFMVTMDGSAHETQHSLLRHLLNPTPTQRERGGLGGAISVRSGPGTVLQPAGSVYGVAEMPEGVATARHLAPAP